MHVIPIVVARSSSGGVAIRSLRISGCMDNFIVAPTDLALGDAAIALHDEEAKDVRLRRLDLFYGLGG